MENNNQKKELLHPLSSPNSASAASFSPIKILVIAIVLGIISGLVLSKINQSTAIGGKAKKTVGIQNKKVFKDSATGILKEGGVDGEGNFHIERPGGASQNVYLTSSVVDLSLYVGKKVRVWGETFKGQKAAWLMDVGLVELL